MSPKVYNSTIMKKHDTYAICWIDSESNYRKGRHGLKPCGNDLRKAKREALSILAKWLDRQRKVERKLKGSAQSEWDWLIMSNTATVFKWNETLKDYYPLWAPESKDLVRIGWVEFSKRTDGGPVSAAHTPKGKRKPNEIWVATYKEVREDGEEGAFGCLGGKFYGTMAEAWNAIKNDVEEYKIGLTGKVETRFLEKNSRAEVVEDGKVSCVWEPQLLQPALEG